MEEKQLNHIVKDKIKKIEDQLIPGSNWDKKKSWNKIKELLNTKNKQLIMWYFATAASISVLIAATVETSVFDMPFLEQAPQEKLVETPKNHMVNPTSIEKQVPTRTFDHLDVKRKEVDFLKSPRCYSAVVKPKCTTIEKTTNVDKEVATSPTFSFDKGLAGTANQRVGFAPSFVADLKYSFDQKGTKSRFVTLGVSTSFIYQARTESSKSVLYPATFVNAKYGETKLKNNQLKEWEMGAGYLLNPNQIIYKDTTIRLHYLRTLTGKFKFGPEIIFTDNFRKLYPGITLAFG